MNVTEPTGKNDCAWLSPWRFAVGLAALVVLTHPELITGLRTLVARDFGSFSYPLAFFQRECFWRGEWPLWNPYVSCGVPFLAQWNTVACSPASLLYLLLPLPWSLNVFVLVFQFWAGLGMYFLAYRWTQHRLAAAVAGVGFAFGGFMAGSFMWSNFTPLCWMPWMLWLVEDAWRKGGRAWLLAAGAGAMQMLGGAPDFTLATWVILGLLFLVDVAREPEARLLRLTRFAGLVVVISALSAMQLLPFFQLIGQSERNADYGNDQWPMPAWGWANLLVPLFRVERGTSGMMSQPGQYYISSYYPGVAILALGLWALGRLRQGRVWLLGAIMGVCLVLALGEQGWLYGALRRAVPAVGAMRYPVRFVVLVIFLLPLLAALAVRAWCEAEPVERRKHERWALALGAVLLAGMGAMVLWAKAHPLNTLDLAQTAGSAGSRAVFLVLALGLMGVFVRSVSDKARSLAAAGLLLVVWLDGATHSPGQNPTADPALLMGKGPALESMPSPPAAGQGRVMLSFPALQAHHSRTVPDPTQAYLIRRLTLIPNCNLLDHIPIVEGFVSVYLAAEREVACRLYGPDGMPLAPMADFLGVSHVMLSPDQLEWAPRSNALPMVTAGQKPLFLAKSNTLECLRAYDFNPAKMVFLPREIRGEVTATNATQARVSEMQFTAQRLTFQVEADAPSLVVIAQCHYPCWRARVDGVTVPLWRANHAFQALQVPAGRHQVSVTYEDRAFQAGLGISLVTALGCGVGWFRLKRREAETGY